MSAWDTISMTIHDFNTGETECVYTAKEFSDKTGVSVQSLNRFDRSAKFKAKRIVYNNRTYRYYTQSQLDDFLDSDFYLSLPMIKNRDLIGTNIGKLFIRDFSESAKKKGYYGSYLCECECGNIVELARSELISGKHLSCGCKFKNLVGMNFGYWHVDELAEPLITPSNFKVFRYKCTCRCGTKRTVIARSLTTGASYSCGCFRDEVAMSKYEFCVCQYLESLGLSRGLGDNKVNGYVQHKSYDDLLGVGGHRLSYDFLVQMNGMKWLIECQGGQHYFPVPLWGGEEMFERQKEHDMRKREYADSIHVLLIEIPYTCFSYDEIVAVLQENGIRFS